MNINTKQITAIAVLSLFAYTANAQTAQIVADPGAPFLDAGLTITPVANNTIPLLADQNAAPILGTTVANFDVDTQVYTETTVNTVGSWAANWTNSSAVDGNGAIVADSVIINNSGITLNQELGTTTTVAFNVEVTEVATLTNGVMVSEWVARAVDLAGNDIVGIAGRSSTISEADAYNTMSNALTGFGGLVTPQHPADQQMWVDAGVSTGPVAQPATGGNLTVGGTLAAGSISDVETSITDNSDAITTLNGDATVAGSVANSVDALATGAVAANAQAVTDLTNGAVATNTQGVADNAQAVTDLTNGAVATNTQGVADNAQAVTDLTNGAVADNAQAVTDLATGAVAANAQAVTDLANGAVQGNTGAITTLNGDATVDGSVANSIAAANAATGISGNGITGVVEKQTNAAGDDIVKLGANSFFFNSTTDTISSTSGDITLAADVAITGDLEVAGDIFVGGRSQGVQSQIDNNREDIDRNARGIAMVAALQHTTVLPGMSNALDVSAAHFEGETGLALNYARRISDNVQINFGAASTSDFDESVIKAGVGVQW